MEGREVENDMKQFEHESITFGLGEEFFYGLLVLIRLPLD